MAKKDNFASTVGDTGSPEIANPAILLKAAEDAPRVFNIAHYFRPIYVMREKGYSWREIGVWLGKFNILISPVHLRRLYVQEHKRLSLLSADELRRLGASDELITQLFGDSDPTGHLIAADPESAAIQARRAVTLVEAGMSEEHIEREVDLGSPIKIGESEI